MFHYNRFFAFVSKPFLEKTISLVIFIRSLKFFHLCSLIKLSEPNIKKGYNFSFFLDTLLEQSTYLILFYFHNVLIEFFILFYYI